MARTFGGASTDKVDITAYTDVKSPTTYTYACWAYRTGEGGNSAGRMIDNGIGGGTGNNGTGLFNRGASTAAAFTATQWTTTIGTWTFPRGAASSWHHYAATYDLGSTANVPVCYLNAVSQTVTAVSNPSGTNGGNDVTHTIIGNNPAGTRVWAGNLAEPAIWNRVLSANEIAAIYYGGVLAVPSGLVFYVPMVGDASPEPNYYNGAGNGTVTGTTVGDHPPIPTMFSGRRRRTVQVAPSVIPGNVFASPVFRSPVFRAA